MKGKDLFCLIKRWLLCYPTYMAREISVERITKLEDSLSGSNTLLIIEKSMVEFTKW